MFAQITFTISAENVLSVDATDLDSGRHYTWQTTGGALIANGVNAAMLRDGVLPYTTLSATQVRLTLHEAMEPRDRGSCSVMQRASQIEKAVMMSDGVLLHNPVGHSAEPSAGQL